MEVCYAEVREVKEVNDPYIIYLFESPKNIRIIWSMLTSLAWLTLQDASGPGSISGKA